MEHPELLAKICEWYAAQCDGQWEHGPGIRITTIDNPGWMVKINLLGTPAEDIAFEKVIVEKSKTDWLHCFKKDGEFIGAGDPAKLATILEKFLSFVGRREEGHDL